MKDIPIVPSEKLSPRRSAKRDVVRILWASALAHELRNPLNAMAMNLSLIGESLKSEGKTELLELLKATRNQIDNMAAILEQFLTYTKPPVPKRVTSDLNQLIKDTIAFLRADYEKSHIAIRFHLKQNLPQVSMDPTQIRSVLINILSNAKRALPNGGNINIASNLRDHLACLIIENDGPPIEGSILGKLFQPFVSGFGGTGLGLAIARRIILEHYGTISAHNREDGGPIFTVCLPLARD